MEHIFKELSILDIFIKNQNGQIIPKIYNKPIDTQQYKVITPNIITPYTIALSEYAS